MAVDFRPSSITPSQAWVSSSRLKPLPPIEGAPELDALITLLNGLVDFIDIGRRDAAATLWSIRLTSSLAVISQFWDGIPAELQKIRTQQDVLANREYLEGLQSRAAKAGNGIERLLHRLRSDSDRLPLGFLLLGTGIDSADACGELLSLLRMLTDLNQYILSLLKFNEDPWIHFLN